MEKTVYCSVGERSKRIKFTSRSGSSDLQCIRQALKNVSEKDAMLRPMMRGKFLILERMDPNINRLCEIEDDDDVPNLAEITVTLITSDKDEPSETNRSEMQENDDSIAEIDDSNNSNYYDEYMGNEVADMQGNENSMVNVESWMRFLNFP